MQRGCEIHFTIRRGEPECGGRGTETSGFGGYNSQSGWCDGQIFPPASVLPLGLARGGTFPKNPQGPALRSAFRPLCPVRFQEALATTPLCSSIGTCPLGGKFSSTWDFVSASDEFPAGYLFSHGKFLAATIPEPGTSGFMATGPAGIIGVIRRKRNCRSSV